MQKQLSIDIDCARGAYYAPLAQSMSIDSCFPVGVVLFVIIMAIMMIAHHVYRVSKRLSESVRNNRYILLQHTMRTSSNMDCNVVRSTQVVLALDDFEVDREVVV